jgi:hypothetical protein
MKIKLKESIKKIKQTYLKSKKCFFKLWKNNPLQILIPSISILIFIGLLILSLYMLNVNGGRFYNPFM